MKCLPAPVLYLAVNDSFTITGQKPGQLRFTKLKIAFTGKAIPIFRTMQKIITCFLVIFCTTNLCAQTSPVDSLKLLLAKEKTDTGKINLLIKKGSHFGFGMMRNDSAFSYLQQALDWAQRIKYINGEINAGNYLANYLFISGNYSEALKLSLTTIKMAEQYNANWPLFNSTRAVGWIYGRMGDPQKELEYARKLKALAQSGNSGLSIQNLTWIANNCIAKAYSDLNMPDSFLHYIQIVYESGLKNNNLGQIALALVSLGGAYSEKGNDDSAFLYYRMSIPYGIKGKRQDVVAASKLGMADLFTKRKQADSALFYARQALLDLQNTDDPDAVMSAYSLLTKLYKNSHQYDSAYRYMENFMAMKDSLYNQNKITQAQNFAFNEARQQQEIVQAKKEAQQQYAATIKYYILAAIIAVFLIIASVLFRSNRNKRKSNILLGKQKDEIQAALSELRSTQSQLIQSEKMASLGELTAGIAHEIQNPLNFVNNFSEVNQEMVDEATEEINKGNIDEAKNILNDIKENSGKINHHGKRADAIVKSMLQHSRTNSGKKELTDINALADEYLRLSYHACLSGRQGMRAKDKSFNCEMKTEFDETIGKINVVPQDIGRVLLNLFNNAFYAVNERQKSNGDGYVPTVTLVTRKGNDHITITVTDNGNGIPGKIRDKIFQPFFTTKPTGSGTGLGLSLSYDIVTKEHNGTIKVESKEGEGSDFIIILPGLTE